MAREVETRTGKYWMDEDSGGILRWTFHPGTKRHGLADARENHAALLTFLEGKKYPFLCDLRNCQAVEGEAREFYSGGEATHFYTAMAFLGGSAVSTMIGTVIVAAGKVGVATKFFAQESEAIQWLRGFSP